MIGSQVNFQKTGGVIANTGLIAISEGDKVALYAANLDDTGDLNISIVNLGAFRVEESL